MRRSLIAAVMALFLGTSLLASGQSQSPTAVLKSYNARIERLLKTKAPKGSPEEERLKEDIRKVVSSLMGFEELAQQAMSRHWDAMTPAQRREFTGVFRDLIERNYAKQIRGNVDYKVAYKGEKVEGDRASVRTVLTARRRGRTADTVVEYRLVRKDGKWKVYDIITDEDEYSSLIRNYRSEFNRIWSKEGYAGVMAKMRKKLAELK